MTTGQDSGAGSPADVGPVARADAPTPGEPTAEEVAAIVAAIETAWPRPAAPSPPVEAPRWRFSGRWWSKPIPARRDRPG